MSKRRTRQDILEEKQRLLDVDKRFLDPNMIARKFCWSHKLTVYPALQRNTNFLRVFVQHHEPFLPVSEDLYDQDNPKHIKEMYAEIDIKYEEFYEQHKHKGEGKF